MPDYFKIVGIKRKGKNVLLASVDGEEILLTSSAVEKHGLKHVGQIEYSILDEIKYESDMERAEDYVNYLLARRSYSTGSINRKLEEKGYPKRVCERIVRLNIERGFLNDERFAREMVESVIRNKPAGKSYILGKLRQKYIPRRLAESIIDELMANRDEVELAYQLIESRWRYFSKFDVETARRKTYNYLSRRAIGFIAAKTAFERILKEDE
ncbi:MAG: regulatory protein RecX [Candidatus Zixiibacteriota bacterium]